MKYEYYNGQYGGWTLWEVDEDKGQERIVALMNNGVIDKTKYAWGSIAGPMVDAIYPTDAEVFLMLL